MASNLDDQTLDVEGWEIANGHQQSPELTNNQQCPDVVLKVQPLPGSNEKQFLQCPFCLKGYKFLKNLGCHCNACMNCAERMLSQWHEGSEDGEEDNEGKKTRLCTMCDQEHTVPILVHKVLKPTFQKGALKCMSCHMRKDTQDGWWCQDCSLILCSKCAHKGHRDHATVEFDQDYDAVRFSLSMLQMETQETATKMKTMVWAKFEQIFKIIEAAIDHELESQNKARRMRLTDVFGHFPPNQSSDNGYEIHRRLSVIQQRAKQQFPHVLDEILSLSGLGTRENISLQTDIVAEKIVKLLISNVKELEADDFKISVEQTAQDNPEETNAEKNSDKIMYVGDTVQNFGTLDNRHY